MKRPYLFKFTQWHSDPPQYYLSYAETEEEARKITRKKCFYNDGGQAELRDIISCTYGL